MDEKNKDLMRIVRKAGSKAAKVGAAAIPTWLAWNAIPGVGGVIGAAIIGYTMVKAITEDKEKAKERKD